MQKAIEVSVVMPCYNHGAFIEEAVDSVLKQSLKSFEIIIVDDASPDKQTTEKIKALEKTDPCISAIFLKENSGPSVARNLAIKHSRGSYILPLDADDKIAPTYLEKALAEIKKGHGDVIYCKAEFFGRRKGEWKMKPFSHQNMLFANAIFSSALYRKTEWEKYGGYNENMRNGLEDWDFWLYFVEDNKRFIQLNDILFYYRIQSFSRSTIARKNRRAVSRQLRSNHPNLFTLRGYYLTWRYIQRQLRDLRRFLFWVSFKRNRRVVRLFGIYLLKDEQRPSE